MNKTEFLNELEKRIRVLDKNEINDILGEYSQHIDMRKESGLSEEDAIKDFGDMDELASEILEAYHVNPEYDKELKDSGIGKKAEALAEEITSSVGGPLRKLFVKCKELIIKIYLWAKVMISKAASHIVIIKEKKNEKNTENAENSADGIAEGGQAAENKTKAEKKHGLFSAKGNKKDKKEKKLKTVSGADIGKQVKKTKGRCRRLIEGFVTLCISVIAILCLIPITIAMLFSVFGLGISVIMMFSGYPIAGIFVILLGASVAAIALWLLLATFVGRRKNKNNRYEGSSVKTEKREKAKIIRGLEETDERAEDFEREDASGEDSEYSEESEDMGAKEAENTVNTQNTVNAEGAEAVENTENDEKTEVSLDNIKRRIAKEYLIDDPDENNGAAGENSGENAVENAKDSGKEDDGR